MQKLSSEKMRKIKAMATRFRVYQFIRTYMEREECCPVTREICAALNISNTTVTNILNIIYNADGLPFLYDSAKIRRLHHQDIFGSVANHCPLAVDDLFEKSELRQGIMDIRE